ncbi:hypothetical protein AYI69_g7377, partial [Smittium culicis]
MSYFTFYSFFTAAILRIYVLLIIISGACGVKSTLNFKEDPEGIKFNNFGHKCVCQAESIEKNGYKPLKNSDLKYAIAIIRHGARTPQFLTRNEVSEWNDCTYLNEFSVLRNNDTNRDSKNLQLLSKTFIPKSCNSSLSGLMWK